MSKRKQNHYFRKGEIRWMRFGQNIGTEIYGKGKSFLRPGLILQTPFFNSAVVIPLSSKKKKGSYYSKIIDDDNNIHYALLHQIRYLDGRRIEDKLSYLNPSNMKALQEKLFNFLLQ